MAVSRERKDEQLAQYTEWIAKSKSIVVTQYSSIKMKQVDELRAKLREVGGEFHVVKNTLGKIALERAGYPTDNDLLTGVSAFAFGFDDPAAFAKVVSDFIGTGEQISIKGGYLADRVISAAEVKALANLPALPVLRAMLLGTILAPASSLARLLAEPARGLAAVIQAHNEPPADVSAAA